MIHRISFMTGHTVISSGQLPIEYFNGAVGGSFKVYSPHLQGCNFYGHDT
jgi:hypothetical protein